MYTGMTSLSKTPDYLTKIKYIAVKACVVFESVVELSEALNVQHFRD